MVTAVAATGGMHFDTRDTPSKGANDSDSTDIVAVRSPGVDTSCDAKLTVYISSELLPFDVNVCAA